MMSMPASCGVMLVAWPAKWGGWAAADNQLQVQQKRQKEMARVGSWKSATCMARVLEGSKKRPKIPSFSGGIFPQTAKIFFCEK